MRSPPTLLLSFVLLMLAACDGAKPTAATPAASAATPAVKLLIAPEDLLTVQASPVANGPVITGSIQPGRRADLRAEVPSVVMKVLKENGEPVRAGELIMQLDPAALRESLASADAAVRAATQSYEQAGRQLERLQTLQQQGMVTRQALEDAQVRRNAASSDQLAARSRVAAARQQLEHTQVRAPFDGLVSERKASVGDTALVGKELVKVIDPTSMRFEGLVSADRLGELTIGQPVQFRINGYGTSSFDGTVQRVDAAVNAATRQVAVTVAFSRLEQAPRVAGLFAEGRITGSGVSMPTLPDGALQRLGESVHVWRVAGNRLEQVALKLGDRDPRSGLYPVLAGVSAGDRILAHPGSSLVNGQAIEMVVRGGPAATMQPLPGGTGVLPASAAAAASAAISTR